MLLAVASHPDFRFSIASQVAHARGWAPSCDDRVGVEMDRGLIYLADASGPTYGGYHAPIAVDAGLESFLAAFDHCREDAALALRRGIAAANERMLQTETVARALTHRVTSLTGIALEAPDRAVVAQVGSSRAILVRRGHARVLVREHTLASTLVAEGRSADEHPQSWRVVTRLVGFAAALEAEVAVERLERGDRLVLCSDGAWACPDFDARIVDVLKEGVALGGLDALATTCAAQTGDDATIVVLSVESRGWGRPRIGG